MASGVQINPLGDSLKSSPLEHAPAQRSRSFFVGLLIVAYALFSLSGWVRLAESILDWHWLTFAGVWPGPLYLALTGGLWGLAGLLGAVWLWQRRSGWRWAGMGVALFLALTYWLDKLLVAHLDTYGGNTLFAGLYSLLGLAFAAAVLRPWEETGLRKGG